jgi:hypothetical protein
MAAPPDQKRSPADSGERGRADSQGSISNQGSTASDARLQADPPLLIGAVSKNFRERFELRLRDFGRCRRLAFALAHKSQSDNRYRTVSRPLVFGPALISDLRNLLDEAEAVCIAEGVRP